MMNKTKFWLGRIISEIVTHEIEFEEGSKVMELVKDILIENPEYHGMIKLFTKDKNYSFDYEGEKIDKEFYDVENWWDRKIVEAYIVFYSDPTDNTNFEIVYK